MTYNALLATTEDGSPIELSYEQRADHTYLVGITGKGKSTLMAQLALADMNHPDRPGLCVLDPHGTLVEDILARVPEHRLSDVILIDPADPDFPFAFNLFAPMPDQVELDRYASELVGVFEATFGTEWQQVADTMRNITLTLLGRNSQGNLPNTDVPAIPAMDEIPHLLHLERIPEGQEKRPYWNQERVTYRALFYEGLQDAGLINVLEFWKGMYDNLTPRLKMGTVQRLVERLNRFLANPLMARTLAQTENKLDFDAVLNDGRILLVNLSKSQLGEENSRFLGSVILARMTAAIFKRDPRRTDQLRRFHVIIDEFQNLITSSFPKLFTDGRKFGVDVVVAHQKRGENPWAERTTAAAGNLICFELHGGDQRELANEFDLTPPVPEDEYEPVYRDGHRIDWYVHFKQYKPGSDPYDKGENVYELKPGRARPYNDVQLEVANMLAHLGKYKAMFKLSNEEETNRVGTTLPLPEPTLSNEQLAEIRDRTRNQHCRPRAEVDKELLQRYQARLRAVGHTDWEIGKPLPEPPRYSSDDVEPDED